MANLKKIVQSDYLQYIRSYAFLITLAIALYASYSFVPPMDASYTTLTIGKYVGVTNSAWSGYTTAMMTSVFLSVSGFFLISSNIKRDADSGVGMIIATTPISNRKYLLSKVCSNFLVLASITGVIIVMSVAVFISRKTPFPFEPLQFVLPFLVITLPALFVVSCLAVLVEVLFNRYVLIANVAFFMLFMVTLAHETTVNANLDFLGIRSVMVTLSQKVTVLHPGEKAEPGMGFRFHAKNVIHTFEFSGMQWTPSFLFSRLIWIGTGLAGILICAPFFHRFDIKPRAKKQSAKKLQAAPGNNAPADIRLSLLPKLVSNFSIMPLLRIETLLMLRKGPQWMWLLTLGGMVAMLFVPLGNAIQYVLPCLWFLQVGRWSDLATREKVNHIHHFSYAACKPLRRVFTAQVLSGLVISLATALPLVLRLLIHSQFVSAAAVLTGAVFIVSVAVLLGLMTGGKKLFEILFFLCTYTNVNKVPVADYFGGLHQDPRYVCQMLAIATCLMLFSFIWRKWELRQM